MVNFARAGSLQVTLLALAFLVACRRDPSPSVLGRSQTASEAAIAIPSLAATLAPLTTTTTTPVPPTATVMASPTVTATPTASSTPTPTATPDPYAGMTVADLAARTYGGGELVVAETLDVTASFTRTLITYPSDGLAIHGFMNIPAGEGPFPVALVLHGYIPPRQYNTLAYTTRYADALARAGYLTIHPNYRNHPPSDETPAFAAGERDEDFRVGYAVDILNLIAIIQERGGQEGALRMADPADVYLLGHSMGGGIALRVITVTADVAAAALYGSMSGDEYKNYERILFWTDGEVGTEQLAIPPEDMARISPIHHLDRIQAAVSIHHGALDDQVPPEWSDELCQQLQALAIAAECYSYADQPHTFYGSGDQLLQQRVIDFFNRH